jgi:uncharacterized membrane protein SpoIIM required for sporulation
LNLICSEVKTAFVENKYLFGFSATLFFVPLFLAYFIPDLFSPTIDPLVNTIKENVKSGKIQLETMSLFYNNISVALMAYVGAIFIGIIPIFILVYNGIFIGYFATQYDLSLFLMTTLPHGIFEILGIIISGTAGFTMLSFIILFIKGIMTDFRGLTLKEKVNNSLNSNISKLTQSLVLLALAVVLILIAAFIEANLTLKLASFIFNIL